MTQESQLRRRFSSVYHMLPRIVNPGPTVTIRRERLRIQFISGLCLVAIPILVVAQIGSEAMPDGIPYYLIVGLIVFMAYLLSRTGHIDAASGLTIIAFSIFPYYVLIVRGFWNTSFSLLVVVWIPITLLMGSYLLSIRNEAVLIIIHNVIFSLVVMFHPGVSLFISEGLIDSELPLLGVSLLIFTGSWAGQRLINMLMETNESLDLAKSELEIYFSLVSHDLGNDLQTITNMIELASNLLPRDEGKCAQYLASSEATIDRMSGLLKVFTMECELSSSDVVTILKDIAEQSRKMSSGLKVDVMVEGTVETCTQIRRLLPVVFENLLRNAVEHAGLEPSVQISVKQVDNSLHITVRDNGPGMSSGVRTRLFQRGNTTGQDGRGQGLYLSRKVLELYGGSIKLLDEPEQSGCTFSIILPMECLKV